MKRAAVERFAVGAEAAAQGRADQRAQDGVDAARGRRRFPPPPSIR